MAKSPPVSSRSRADEDSVARKALWQAICYTAEQLAHTCKVLMVVGGNPPKGVIGAPVPPVRTWQLVEGLSQLTILVRASKVKAATVTLFVKCGPTEFLEDNRTRFLWSQCTVEGLSELNGRPDLLVTASQQSPSAGNVLRIIEAKCHRTLGTHEVRYEFAKGHDLRVPEYFIWTFYTASARIVDGARRLGIEIEPLGLDSDLRQVLIKDPAALAAKVAHTLEQSKKRQRFAQRLDEASEDTRRKLRQSGNES